MVIILMSLLSVKSFVLPSSILYQVSRNWVYELQNWYFDSACVCVFYIRLSKRYWIVPSFDCDAEDVSTDGKWCYLVFWVFGKQNTRWGLLKKRLSECCPSCSSASGISFYRTDLEPPKPSEVFLLKFCCHDRRGLLHGTSIRTSNSALINYICTVSRFCWSNNVMLHMSNKGVIIIYLSCSLLFCILARSSHINICIYAGCPSSFYHQHVCGFIWSR